jgi:hypothetical protein
MNERMQIYPSLETPCQLDDLIFGLCASSAFCPSCCPLARQSQHLPEPNERPRQRANHSIISAYLEHSTTRAPERIGATLDKMSSRVQSQAGLKLEPKKAQVDILIVD